jgi:O-acetyl-ADP-ribose deacetylase (regulator of RNase III)
MYKEVIGNLVEEAAEYDVVVQGCNCQNVMGAGIAYYLREKYPQIYEADTIAFKEGRVKLGNYSYWHNNEIDTTFVNAYTQFDTKGRRIGKADVSYEGIRDSLCKVNNDYKGKHIGLPLIGCGLAGGNWKKVKRIIQEELVDVDVTVVFLLTNYMQMKVVEFFDSEFNLDLYDKWNEVKITMTLEDYVYDLNLNRLSNTARMVPHYFANKLNSKLLSLECIEDSKVDNKNNFIKLNISDDCKSYCK